MATSDLQPIYAVLAEAVPVLIEAYELGPHNFRIRLARGIGWTPTRYKKKDAVLQALLGMQSYSVAEARMCNAICTPKP